MLHSIVDFFLSDKGYKRLQPIASSSLSSISTLLNISAFALTPSDTSKTTTTTTTMSDKVSNKNNCPRSVSLALKRLPRKASRLVCIADPSSCTGRSQIQDDDLDLDEEAILAGLVQRPVHSNSNSNSSSSSNSSSRTGTGTGTGSSMNEGSLSLHSKSSQASSLLSSYLSQNQNQNNNKTDPAVLSGPIISPDELARALSLSQTQTQTRLSLSSETQPTPPLPTPTPTRKKSTPAPAPGPGLGSINLPAHTPGPRSLSPPPAHFRRRVLSASGSGSGPYTSPTSSPPHSPGPLPLHSSFHSSTHSPHTHAHAHAHAHGRQTDRGIGITGIGGTGAGVGAGVGRVETTPTSVRLHDLLSSTSLVAPPLRLYDSARDARDPDPELKSYGEKFTDSEGEFDNRGRVRGRVSSSVIQAENVGGGGGGGVTVCEGSRSERPNLKPGPKHALATKKGGEGANAIRRVFSHN